jgi:hypothetical protein
MPLAFLVGRTPWSAAGPPAGFLARLCYPNTPYYWIFEIAFISFATIGLGS